ncbi:hypothetical protein GOBAR_AA29519 [Gossypium barbadense]|uniref:NAC domain-containing protein n=1 Tax=Gossypium barbadense TaxID=3634 RepID=A0A2P5WJD3_GOSBA|nr:hypothetical protein GOBAR_AA29519 [Gossypium barbadense]
MNSLRLNGLRKLPPGFRFQPTEEELVFQYLKCKAFSFPLPASIIPDLNICNFDPWDLPGDLGEERYFFSVKEAKYKIGNRINWATASGYWKATGSDKQIISRRNQVAGMRKTLVFHMGKPPHGLRTDWIMHEYRLVNNYLNHGMEKWVLCHVFLKRTSKKSSEEEIMQSFCNKNRNEELGHRMEPKLYNFMREKDAESSSSSSASSRSDITEVSSSACSRQY